MASTAADSGQDTASAATQAVEQTVEKVTKAPAPVIERAKETVSSATPTVEQTVEHATQATAPVVERAKEATSAATKTVEQTVEQATQVRAPVVDRAKDVVSSVEKTAEEALPVATPSAPRSEDAESGVQQPAMPAPIVEAPASPAAEADGESGSTATPSTWRMDDSDGDDRTAVGSTAPTADSVGPTHRQATRTQTEPAKGGAASTSERHTSVLGGPVLKTDAGRRALGTTLQSSQGVTVARGRGLVPQRSSRPHTDVVAGPSSTASEVQRPSPDIAGDTGGLFSSLLPEVLWPSVLPSPVVIAQWLLYAATALLLCIAVLLASGVWARQRVLKF